MVNLMFIRCQVYNGCRFGMLLWPAAGMPEFRPAKHKQAKLNRSESTQKMCQLPEH